MHPTLHHHPPISNITSRWICRVTPSSSASPKAGIMQQRFTNWRQVFGILGSPLPRFAFCLKFSYSSPLSGFRETCREAQLRHRQINNLASKILYTCFLTHWEKYREGLLVPALLVSFFFFFSFHFLKITHYVPIVLTTISHTRFLAGHGLPRLNPTLYLADGKIPLAARHLYPPFS